MSLYKIDLAEPAEGVYRGGCRVTGFVTCSLYAAAKLQSIELTLTGTSTWKTSSNVGETVLEEEHVSETIILLAQAENLRRGTYYYPFQFTLPEDIPPTFKLKNDAKIKYILALKVIYDCVESCVKKIQREIHVYGNYGIILRTLSTTSRVFRIEKEWFTQSSEEIANIKVLVYVDKSFVTPGEFVNLRLLVKNFTDIMINCIRIQIVRKITITSEYDLVHEIYTKSYKKFAVNTAEIPSYSEIELPNNIQVLPEFYSIPKTRESQLIVVDYLLKVSVMLPPPYQKMSTLIPIVVGVKPGMEDLGVIEFDDFEDIEFMDALNEWNIL